MSSIQYKLVDYGLTNALQNVFPAPIVGLADPTTSNKAQIGTVWVNKSTNSVFILTSIVNNSANWANIGGGAGVFTSLTVTPGPISLTGTTTINTTGAASTTIGTGGTGTVSIGNATGNTAVTGVLTVSSNIFATNGSISAGNTAASTAGANVQMIKSRGGGVITTGDVLGNIIFAGNDGTTNVTSAAIVATSSGTIGTGRVASALTFLTHPDSVTVATVRMTIASTGAVTVAAPDSGTGLTVSGGGATVTAGNITATNGNIVLSTAATYISLPGPVFIYSGAGAPGNGLALHVGDLYINTTGSGTTDRLFIATGVGAWTYFVANA